MTSKKLFITSILMVLSLALVIAISAVFTAIKAREFVQAHTRLSYQVKNPKGIDELKAIEIGGVEQWLHIRGRNRENPVLLYLHGGPGTAMIGMTEAVQRPWEDFFTVVHWDQRQRGKSYYPATVVGHTMTLAQMIADTEEVIEFLRAYFQQDKIVVLGHSWGSYLGMQMVKRHPEWIAAYIGMSQVVNMMANDQAMYQRLLALATAKNDREVLVRLKQIPMPFPDLSDKDRYNKDNYYIQAQLSRLAGEALMHHYNLTEAGEVLIYNQLLSPHYNLTDVKHFLFGDKPVVYDARFSFLDEVMAIDLPREIGSTFEVPIFFFTGAYDWQAPHPLSAQWFEEIEAPYKELVWFEESAHVVINEEPGKFLLALVEHVLPFTKLNETQH